LRAAKYKPTMGCSASRKNLWSIDKHIIDFEFIHGVAYVTPYTFTYNYI